ncbi:ankyrin repeat-containing domain protein [Umbelopsis sp. PMI_123]|nr:ankyrin repeat-containing domain protein [Umbelopsis sp. PMI_123]
MDIEAKSRNQRTPLHFAALRGHMDAILLLLEYNASIYATDDRGDTVLHFASQSDSPETISLFLDLGIDIEVSNKLVGTPLLISLSNNPLHKEVIYMLLKHGANANARIHNSSSFHSALFLKDEIVVHLLILHDVNIAEIGPEVESTLHLATSVGTFGLIHLLLDRGVNINLKHKYGEAPLHILLEMLNKSEVDLPLLQLLLDSETDIFLLDGKESALDKALNNHNYHAARLLLQVNMDIAFKSRRKPIHIAGMSGNQILLQYIFQNNISIDEADENGYTALHFAVKREDLKFAAQLLHHGASIHQTDNDGRTLLHLAARYDLRKSTPLLLSIGARVDAHDKEKKDHAVYCCGTRQYTFGRVFTRWCWC